jgi:hypothetical protein
MLRPPGDQTVTRKLETILLACAVLGVVAGLALPALSQPKSPDVVTGAGPGGRPAAAGGLNVAAGDVNGDGVAMLLPAIQKVRDAANRSRASDALLKFEPINGASTQGKGDDHREHIEIASWSLGATNTASCSGSSGTGTLTLSGASLNPAAAKSDKPRIAVLEVKPTRGPGQSDALTDGLLILRFEGLTPARSQPMEQVALNYSKVSWNRPGCKADKR